MSKTFLVRDRSVSGFDEATHLDFSALAGTREAKAIRGMDLQCAPGQSFHDLQEMIRHLLAGTVPASAVAGRMQAALREHIAKGVITTHQVTRKNRKAKLTITQVHVATGATIQDAFPALPTDGWGYVDKSASPVFLTIDVNDISQGQLADCYFLAALQGLADLDPAGHDYLKYLLQPDVDASGTVLAGKWVVYFFRGGTTTRVHIDCEIDGIQDRSGVDGSDGDYWADMIEKAYAFFRYGTDLFHAMDYGWFLPTCSDFGIAAAAVQPKTVAGIGTALQAGQLVGVATPASGMRADMVPNHEYGALAYVHQTKLAQGIVILRNPWGTQGGSQEPEFIEITDADILKYALSVQTTVAPVPQALPSPTDVTATLTANPTSIQQGASVMLAWSTANAVKVTGSWTANALAPTGQMAIYPQVSGSYSITATGANGQSKTASASVTVSTPVVHGKKKNH